jgi:hypothetical protein
VETGSLSHGISSVVAIKTNKTLAFLENWNKMCSNVKICNMHKNSSTKMFRMFLVSWLFLSVFQNYKRWVRARIPAEPL